MKRNVFCLRQVGRFAAALWLVVAASGGARAAEFDAARLVEVAESEMQATNTPGASIGIVRGGEVVWSKGLGVANVETGQEVTPEMLFRLGSTTKMFTAAAVVGLAEEGKLKLHEPVGRCVTGLDPAIGALTLHQCLTHTAGLTDESIMSGRHDDEALAAGVRQFDAKWLFTEPGKIYSYANPGYWIAGLACEELTGQSYGELMAERLFKPLGMTRTTLRPTLAMTWPLALGHEVRGGKAAVVRPQADNAGTWPAGQIYSSVTELTRFATAFMDGGKLEGKQVIDEKVIEALTRPYVPRPGTETHYGYGLGVSTERGVRILEHGGSRTGYGSTIRMAPDQKLAVIILTNRSAMSLPKTAEAALEMLLPFDSPAKRSRSELAELSDTEMTELAGKYTNQRQTIELVAVEGELRVRRRGGEETSGAAKVEKAGDGRLSVRGGQNGTAVGSYFVVRDAEGRAEYLISSGRAYRRSN
jgi:CubicO group peptidase (beta-lactamase class C family)